MPKYSDHIRGMDFDTFFSIVDSMYDEILIYDGNYNIVYINQACARHYCCGADQMIGKSFYDFVNNDWWGPSILPIIYREKKSYAIRQKTYTGSELLTIAVPLFNEQGEITFVVMNVRDQVNDIDLYNPHYISKEYKLDVKTAPIGESDEMKKVLALVEKISQVDVTCILSGESGTGKTMIAKYMHAISPRKNRPFISLNCASIPTQLLESELFGYVKGAFTGANAAGKKGLLEAAHTGTLLLDEVSELSLSAQAKLLHVLQDKEFLPVGGNRPVSVDVRIIAATNKNLKNMVASGQFREDLYYRLNVVEIYIPPLRKRKCDIPLLVHHFLKDFCNKYGVTRQLTESALKVLTDYDWPGNVRELRHLVERLVVTVDSLMINASHLPTNMFGIVDSDGADGGPALGAEETLDQKMQRYEACLVREAFERCGSSRKLADYLGVSQTKANNLIRKYIRATL